MRHADKTAWALTFAAVLCSVCALLALNGPEVQALDETAGLGARTAFSQPAPQAYRADSRSDIMIRAAGAVLN